MMTHLDVSTAITGEGLLDKYTGSAEGPTRDEVARLAYHFYERRGRQHGHDVEDWVTAEQELCRHYR